jgi:hypothetical protein
VPVHANVYEALADVDQDGLPGTPASDAMSCEGAKFHSPTPLLLHRIELPNGRFAVLCGVCRDNLAVLQSLMIERPQLPWEIRREFGNKLRALVMEGTDG